MASGLRTNNGCIPVKDIYGNDFKLSDFRGKKIVLSFYRNVNCPFCNRRVHQIMGNNVKLQKLDIQLIFLFESSNERLKGSVFHQGISPWPLIGDPEKTIYKRYGVEESMVKYTRTIFESSLAKAKRDTKELNLPKKSKDETETLIPADFFINENFVIENAHYGKHLDDHIDLQKLFEFVGIESI